MSKDAKSDEENPYELIGVKLEATDQEIKTAYRQRSLKVHPDRNPNNPDAARKFHELNQAYELLLDPLRRLAVDAKLRLAQARKARYANYDAKRKELVEELERSERDAKKVRVEKQREEIQRHQEEERIKDEGRKKMAERAAELKKAEEEAERERKLKEEEDIPPTLGDLDTTIRLKYSISKHPSLTTPNTLSALLTPFGTTDSESIVLSNPSTPKPGKKPKKMAALIPFRQLGHAFAAVCASGRPERGLDGIEIGWAGGSEPAIIGWLKAKGKLSVARSYSPPPIRSDAEKAPLPQSKTRPSDLPAYSSFPDSFPDLPGPSPATDPVDGIDYESLTLMRMRQAERERLEREIREAES